MNFEVSKIIQAKHGLLLTLFREQARQNPKIRVIRVDKAANQHHKAFSC
jgi:hypothetical protein